MSQGIHRVKRKVSRTWFNDHMSRLNMSLSDFGVALARETGRREPLDKASMSRRLSGKIPFPANEVEALSRIFSTPLDEVLTRVGSSRQEPTSSVIGEIDDANVTLQAKPTGQHATLRVTSEDGWNGAIVTFETAVTKTPGRGLYVVRNHKSTKLQQVIGTRGGQSGHVILAAPFDNAEPLDTQPLESIELHRVTRITF